MNSHVVQTCAGTDAPPGALQIGEMGTRQPAGDDPGVVFLTGQAFSGAENIELVHVQQRCGWRGVLIPARGRVHGYPCQRGSTFQLNAQEALL